MAAEPSFFVAREHARKLFKLVKKLLVDDLGGERCFWETAVEAVFVCPFVCLVLCVLRWVIFNDRKVAQSEAPPKDLGYLYLYKRIDS